MIFECRGSSDLKVIIPHRYLTMVLVMTDHALRACRTRSCTLFLFLIFGFLPLALTQAEVTSNCLFNATVVGNTLAYTFQVSGGTENYSLPLNQQTRFQPTDILITFEGDCTFTFNVPHNRSLLSLFLFKEQFSVPDNLNSFIIDGTCYRLDRFCIDFI